MRCTEERLIVSDMHNDIKRRLLHEIVQDNLATYTAAPSPMLTRVERKAWAMVGKMLLLAVVLVLLPVDDTSTVISTAIEQSNEALRSAPVTVSHPDAPLPLKRDVHPRTLPRGV